jgi:hypothetical protein
MSRSKHTDPAHIRAPRRVRSPHERRGHGNPSARRALLRALKECGIAADSPPGALAGEGPAPLPRLRVVRAREGFHHPAGRADIVRLLRFFGERCTYGLRSIELLQGTGPSPRERMRLGRLMVPGRILLFDQPPSPWLVTGTLPEVELARLQRAGALVECAADRLHTVITWPGHTLRDFMLFDVLLHEIGHHLIQQYRGKRPARVVRTRDHEAFADYFAFQCRLLYHGADGPNW